SGGGTKNTRDRLTASGTITMSSGTLDASGSYAIHAGSFLDSGGGLEPRTGVLVLMSAANSTFTPFGTFYNVHIEDPTETGLAGYWKSDEGNGNSLRDSSGLGNTGTRSGTGSTWSGSTLSSSITFDNASAMKFNATSDFISVPDSATLTTNNFSYCTWLKWDGNRYSTASARDWAAVVSKGLYSSGEFAILFNRDSASAINAFNFYINGGLRTSVTLSSALTTTWHQLCTTYDQVNAKIYLDGIQQASGAYTSAITDTANTLRFGADGAGSTNNYFWGGYLDDIRYYSRALPAGDVMNLARGQYANGANGTAIFGLGSNLVANTLVIDSGRFNGTAYSVDTTNPLTLHRGDGTYTGGVGYSRFGGLTMSGSTFTDTAGSVDINGNVSVLTGSLAVSTATINVSGGWSQTGGYFDNSHGTLIFDGTTTGLSIVSGGYLFNNVSVAGTGGAWMLGSRLNMSGSLAISAGTLDVSASNFVVHAGSINQTGGTFTTRTGTVVLDSSTNQTLTVTSALNTLRTEDPTENGLVGYWKFDEGRGISTRDVSGNGNTGTRSGTGTTWSGSSLATAIGFDNPYAMQFNGTNDYTDMGNASVLNIGTSPYSLSLWFKTPTVQANWRGIAEKGVSNTVNYGIWIASSSFNYRIDYVTGNGGYDDVFSSSSVVANHWYHVVGTWDGTTKKFYVDGVLNGSSVPTTNGKPTSISAAFTVGQARASFFDGNVDDVRLYNRTLSANEVTNLSRGRYARGASSTATQTLAGNLSVATLALDSGNLNTSTYDLTDTNALQLLRGNGNLTADTGTLTLNGGLTVSGATLTGGAGTIDVNGNVYILTGSLVASSGNTTVSGNWNKTGGTFTPNNGTIALDGTNQALTGSTTFYNFTKSVSSADTFKVASGTLMTVSNALTLNGAAGNLLTLRSGTAGNQWNIDPQGARVIDYVDVADSNNINATAMNCISYNCTNSGNNTNWTFATASSSSSSVAQNDSGGGGGGGHHGAQTTLKSALDARLALQERFKNLLAAGASSSQSSHTSSLASFVKKSNDQKTTTPAVAAAPFNKLSEKRGHLVAFIGDTEVLFRDVQVNSWYAPYVATLVADNIVRGYTGENGKPNGLFGVAAPITRAEVLKMALAAAGKKATGHLPLPRNISARTSWSAQIVRQAEDMHVSVFTPATDVNAPATRGEVVQIIVEILGFPIGKQISTFTDVTFTNPYAAAIAVASFYQLVQGDTDENGTPLNRFRPNDNITRAEVAKIVALANELVK
ncbi:MAG: hypothetical protein JWM56_953, partial [Candidatus Peribacteria bacterium]|nr:hypothetical protein [Candidatus Peribacteria bacterium]